MSLKEIRLPKKYNYIACFLTLECNLKCSYCINSFRIGRRFKRKIIPGERWVEGLNRIVCSEDLPITLQGGEPGMHPDFIWIIKNIKKSLNIDILTNMSFDIDEFIDNIDPIRLRRNAPYPNIRISYHPEYMDLDAFIKKILKMQRAGFSIGIFSILHPKFEQEVSEAKERCRSLGIDFRTKEFLGEFNGQLYGSYFYSGAVGSINRKKCLCRTSELIIGPDTNIYRCHHDLYNNLPAIGNLLDEDFEIEDVFRQCAEFGNCNPCDIKIKTNRFQIYGHTSVEVKDIKE